MASYQLYNDKSPYKPKHTQSPKNRIFSVLVKIMEKGDGWNGGYPYF
jgi:hypothetical protein